MQPEPYDAIVIGSGFGGAMAAHVLVDAGWSVLMLERGDWVRRGRHNWAPGEVGLLTPHYSTESPYHLWGAARDATVGAFHCVGGPSVFYGGVALRFRAEDFEPDPEIAGTSGARWPWTYADIEPYYTEAERLLGVAGESGADPTEPSRSGPYPQRPADLRPFRSGSRGLLATWVATRSACRSRSITRRVRPGGPAWPAAPVTASRARLARRTISPPS